MSALGVFGSTCVSWCGCERYQCLLPFWLKALDKPPNVSGVISAVEEEEGWSWLCAREMQKCSRLFNMFSGCGNRWWKAPLQGNAGVPWLWWLTLGETPLDCFVDRSSVWCWLGLVWVVRLRSCAAGVGEPSSQNVVRFETWHTCTRGLWPRGVLVRKEHQRPPRWMQQVDQVPWAKEIPGCSRVRWLPFFSCENVRNILSWLSTTQSTKDTSSPVKVDQTKVHILTQSC